MDVDVGQLRHVGITRVHAPHARAERHLLSIGIAGINEIVVALRVFTECRVVFCRRQRQRRTDLAAALRDPAASASSLSRAIMIQQKTGRRMNSSAERSPLPRLESHK
jgi:hypothetical protein